VVGWNEEQLVEWNDYSYKMIASDKKEVSGKMERGMTNKME